MTGRDAEGGTARPIPIVEEAIRLDTRRVETGRVRVRTIVDEEQVVAATMLTGNYVTVDRVAMDRVVATVPPVREEGGVTIIPVVEERVRIVRELVLVEEVHVRNVPTVDPVEHTATRRVMRAVIEREDIPKENDQ